MKTALDEIEAHLHRSGSPHPAIMQEFFSEYGVEKLKAGAAVSSKSIATWDALRLLAFVQPTVIVMIVRRRKWTRRLGSCVCCVSDVTRQRYHWVVGHNKPSWPLVRRISNLVHTYANFACAQELAFGPQPGFPTEGAGKMFSDWGRQLQKETDALQAAIAEYETHVEGAAKRRDFTAQGPTRRVLQEWYPALVDAVRNEQQAVSPLNLKAPKPSFA